MDFGDHDIIVDDAGQFFPVCVSAGALRALWGTGTKSMEAEVLIALHRQRLEDIAIRKRHAGLTGCCGRVAISSDDLDTPHPPPF